MNPIEDYYLIGDFHSAALVAAGGSVDWLCWPEFDSPSLFARLLDDGGGSFSVDTTGWRTESRYVENTAVVEHVFRSGDRARNGGRGAGELDASAGDADQRRQDRPARFTVRDYMVPVEKEVCRHHFLVRKLTGILGTCAVEMRFTPRPEYGARTPAVRRVRRAPADTVDGAGSTASGDTPKPREALRFDLGDDTVYLHLPAGCAVSGCEGGAPGDGDAEEQGDGCAIRLRLEAGQSATLALEYCKGGRETAFTGDDPEAFTLAFWKSWVDRGAYLDFCRNRLIRSAITLKLLQYYPTGGLIAAPTTSLPVEIGGTRNWDYRYVWIRDATFTLYAFYVLDYQEEVDRFFGFLKRIAGGEDGSTIRTLYTIRGDAAPEERCLDHLSGYRGSRPVRVGNNASSQLQIDVYGNLIDAHYFMSHKRRRNCGEDREVLIGLFRKIKELWRQKDGGIWEARDELFHYAYSKVMAWLGLDRLIRLQDQVCLSDAELAECTALRDEIARWVWDNCWDTEQRNLVQHPDTDEVDSANLFFVIVKFLDKHDERTREVVANTCRKLCADRVLVYRYLRDDGLPGRDQGFLLCSLWLISALAIEEEVEQANELFDELESRMNDALLMPEQMHPGSGRYLGNYPQAFTHMGFIMAARYLDKYRRRVEERRTRGL